MTLLRLSLLLAALLAGPSFAAGAAEEDPKRDPFADEPLPSHTVSLPGSYVALPDNIVAKMRLKILEARGEAPEDHDSGGGH